MKNAIKFWGVLVALMCLCVSAMAQDSNSKYLEGAVPEVNGKVVFAKTFHIDGMSKAEIYNNVHKWLENCLKEKGGTSRILLANPDRGQIVALCDEDMVFQSNFISLDRANVKFQLIANCSDNNCELEYSKFKYKYEDASYTAEEQIVDAVALNKDKTKLARPYGKFRKGTIDKVDAYNKEAMQALAYQGTGSNNQVTEIKNVSDKQATAEATPKTSKAKKESSHAAKVPKQQIPAVEDAAPASQEASVAATAKPEASKAIVPEPAKAQPEIAAKAEPVTAAKAEPVETIKTQPVAAAKEESAPKGYKVLTEDQVMSRIQQNDYKMVVVIGKDEFNQVRMTPSSGNLAKIGDKAIVYTSLTSDQPYQMLDNAKEYDIYFYANGDKQPQLILQCTKLPSASVDGGQAHTYMGEVVKSMIKK